MYKYALNTKTVTLLLKTTKFEDPIRHDHSLRVIDRLLSRGSRGS